MKFDVDGPEPRYEVWGLCFVAVIANYVYWSVLA